MCPFRSLVVAIAFVASGSASAASQRTFVASTGVDTNPCTITAPCRGFATAVSKTNPDGEVIVLDSAGYGPVTVAQSVSIIAPPGVYGGISVFSGNGITVSGSGITVVLRGLTINGQGGGISGISFTQGTALTVEDCEIMHFSTGVDISAPNSRVGIQNTRTRDMTGYGIYTTGSTLVSIEGANVGAGISANNGSLVTIANSRVEGIHASSASGGYTDVLVTRSTISNADRGISVLAFGGSFARVVSDGNAFNEVQTAFKFEGFGGTEIIYSPGNNAVGFVNVPISGSTLTSLTTY